MGVWWRVIALVAWVAGMGVGAGCSTIQVKYSTDARLNPSPDGVVNSVRVRIFQLSKLPLDRLKLASVEQLYAGDEKTTPLADMLLPPIKDVNLAPEMPGGSYPLGRAKGVRFLLVVPVFVQPDPQKDWWALIPVWPFGFRARFEVRGTTISLPPGQLGWVTSGRARRSQPSGANSP